MHACLLSLDEDTLLVVAVIGGQSKEKEKEGEEQMLDEKLSRIIEAHHAGLLTILEGTLTPIKGPITKPKLVTG